MRNCFLFFITTAQVKGFLRPDRRRSQSRFSILALKKTWGAVFSFSSLLLKSKRFAHDLLLTLISNHCKMKHNVEQEE